MLGLVPVRPWSHGRGKKEERVFKKNGMRIRQAITRDESTKFRGNVNESMRGIEGER